jgi:ABC-2 type transport system permease protein
VSAMARVFMYELRRQGRRRAYLFVTVGLPLIALLLFFGYRLYQQTRATDAATVVTEPDEPSRRQRESRPAGLVDLAGIIKNLGPVELSGLIRFDSEAEAQAAIRDNQISAYYRIAPDYLESGQIDMYFERFSLTQLDASSGLKRTIVSNLASGQGVNLSVVDRLQSKPTITPHEVSDVGGVRQTSNAGTSFFMSYVFILALTFSSFMTSGYLMQSIVEEKETRMVEVLLSSIRPTQLLAGKILALGLLGLIQMLLWGAALVIIIGQLLTMAPNLGIRVPSAGQFALLVAYFICAYLLLSSIYASIGAVSTSMREGPQLAAFATIPIMSPLWALSLITAAPGGSIAVGMSIFPLTAPLTMVSRIAVSDVPPGEIALSLTLLVLTVLLAIWLTGKLFRVNTLLSGRLPKLRDFPRMLTGRL